MARTREPVHNSSYARGEEAKQEEVFMDDENPSLMNRPSPESTTASADPSLAEEKPPAKKSKRKREVNPLFKDVEETGTWGTLEKREVYIAVAFLVVIVIAVIVTVVVLVTGNKDSTPAAASTVIPTPPPTLAPSVRIEVPPEEQLAAIRTATEQYEYALPNSLALLPDDDLFYYIDKWSDTTQPAQVRAASWIMYGDTRDEPPTSPWLLTRYALAVFYYATGGTTWDQSTSWLTEAHVCTWLGVQCDRFSKQLEELDLHSNNVKGQLPDEIVFLQDLVALTLFDNALSGTLPALQLGNMRKLALLSLQTNHLTGTLSESLIENNALNTLFIQENDLNGTFPILFCPPSSQPKVFDEFGLDCKEVVKCICCGAKDNFDPCYD